MLRDTEVPNGRAGGQSPQAPSLHSRGSADALAEDEDALRQAAWRWRFNRRWAQEQARGMDPDYGRQVRPPPLPYAAHSKQKAPAFCAQYVYCKIHNMLLLGSCSATLQWWKSF